MVDEIKEAPAQRELLLFILDVWDRRHRVPTYNDIGAHHGKNKSAVQRTVDILITKGYLKCDRTSSGRVQTGTLEPTPEAFRWRSRERELGAVGELCSLPISCGAVGGPDDLFSDAVDRDAESIDAESIKVPIEYAGPGVFLMEVTGESMNGDHLHTGDHVMIDETASWHDGDMVALRHQGVTRIKRFWDDGFQIVLESSNPEVPPIPLPRDKEHLADLTVYGKIVATICSHIEPGRRSERTRMA